LKTLYADASLLVVEKPAGLLSVPGREEAPSVESLLRQQYKEVYMVHRLDMDTSGLMVVALTQTAYHHLQKQFIARTLFKKYIALLDGMVSGEGTIRLPLRPDPLDRPRQVVDLEQGKSAITDYRVLGMRDEVLGARGEGQTLVELIPHTGRTHQLRVHCAHQAGLNCPIVGDRLYGRPVGSLYGKPVRRLCLHAAELAFCHPATGERLSFSSPVPF
jgi:tRNA pseudouridine32 synthase/23S rRNA pseudouridine746 synthase